MSQSTKKQTFNVTELQSNDKQNVDKLYKNKHPLFLKSEMKHMKTNMFYCVPLRSYVRGDYSKFYNLNK